MNIVEKNRLKEEHQKLKKAYSIIKKEYQEIPRGSKESYELQEELMVIIIKLKDIRRRLMDNTFGRFYPTTILENFVFGCEEEQIRGGR